MSDSSLLLEEIARNADCLFLSDMHQAGNAVQILNAIKRIPYGAYTLPGWKRAAEYITRQECVFDSEDQIREYLLEYCRDS